SGDDALAGALVGIADEIGAVASLKRPADVPSGIGGKGQSAVERHQRMELPALHQAFGTVRKGRQRVQDIVTERVADVEMRVTAVESEVPAIGWIAVANRRPVIDRMSVDV